MPTTAYAYTPYIWPMFISAAFAAALGVYAYRHRSVPGATAFAIHQFGIALWGLFTGIEIAAVPLSVKVVYHQIEGVSAVIAFAAALQFALERTIPNRQTTRRSARRLAAAIGALLVLMLTNPYHHLIWSNFWFDEFVRVGRGPLNFLIVAAVLLLPLASCIVFIRLFVRSVGVHRWQGLMLSVGGLLPVLTFLLEPAGINPIAPLDPVILVWNVSGALYALAIFRFGLLSVVPVGRGAVIERMARGMLILDRDGHIVDLNPAVETLFGLSRRSILGLPAAQQLRDHPALLPLLDAREDARVQFELGSEPSRWIEAQATPLRHPNGFPLGTLLELQDVTDRAQAETRRLQEQWTQATLEERERLAHDLHDGLSQSLSALRLYAQTAQLHLEAGRQEAASESLARLASASRELQGDVREVIGDLLSVTAPAQGMCSAMHLVVERFAEQTGLSVDFETLDHNDADCDAAVPPSSAVQLLRIAQEALANVRRHAGDPRHVHVQLAIEDGLLRMTIADDGVGFDPASPAPTGHHYGLQVMRQRAAHIGGEVHIASEPGAGTRVIVSAPLGQGVLVPDSARLS